MDAGQLGMKNKHMSKERTTSLRCNLWEVFPHGQQTETVLLKRPRFYLLLSAEFNSVRIPQVVLILKS